ncbi:head-tail adaptor protein [Brucella gallinifaecis]|uniref:Head-tail adaptor protein n=1 Tax=Brucella gallinifaecis TaxID=215590 RepID=A0A502BUS7_9HYPH|nr:head-tail adaptor protein [Brucella gallinifaecis]TPF76733.1 head-tail adaptor protein [Brucella gallinifaecis]
MADKRSAGSLYEKITFSTITSVPDGHGGFEPLPTSFTVRANIRYLRGGETVQAARLTGKQPVVVTVRRSSQTAALTTDDKMKDARTGNEYQIRAIVPTEDRQFMEITAESGVAT